MIIWCSLLYYLCWIGVKPTTSNLAGRVNNQPLDELFVVIDNKIGYEVSFIAL